MNDKPEPRSPIKPQSIWNSARVKSVKKTWNWQPKNQRGQLPELPTKIKQIGFNSGIFQWGPYKGPLEDLKDFARTKGVSHLQNGAIKHKIA